MKDLLEILLKGLGGYLPILVRVISMPKTNILQLVAEEPGKLNNALSFAGLTIVITFAFQLPLLAGQDFLTVAGSLLALKIIAFITFAAGILLLFRLVGGRGDFETTLCAGLYIVSPMYLFLILAHSFGMGILSNYDPELAKTWHSSLIFTEQQFQEFRTAAPSVANSFLALQLLQVLLSAGWYLICWGVYREIHQVSRIRSTFVYLIATVMMYCYWQVTVVIMKGLYGGVLSPMG